MSHILENPIKILSTHNAFIRNLSFFKKKPEEKESNYVYLRATKEDKDNILNLMKSAYYTEEPTYTALNIRNPTIPLEGAARSLAEGLSYVARCKYNGCIVGACINSTTNPWDADMKEKVACSIQDPKVRQLYLFYAHIQRAANLYKCYKVQKVYEIEYLFVGQEHRFRGIARKLVELSRQLGRDCGYKIVRCDATNAFTALICEKLKMKKVYELPYCSYIGQDLKPVFNTLPPHTVCKVYIDDNTEICQEKQ